MDSATGQPPLHAAARLGAAAAIKALVAAGAKLEEKDAHSRTALQVRQAGRQAGRQEGASEVLAGGGWRRRRPDRTPQTRTSVA